MTLLSDLETSFHANGNSALWKSTWQEPHMRQGLEILMRRGHPAKLGTETMKTETMEKCAIRGANSEGYFACINGIFSLYPKEQKRMEKQNATGTSSTPT